MAKTCSGRHQEVWALLTNYIALRHANHFVAESTENGISTKVSSKICVPRQLCMKVIIFPMLKYYPLLGGLRYFVIQFPI